MKAHCIIASVAALMFIQCAPGEKSGGRGRGSPAGRRAPSDIDTAQVIALKLAASGLRPDGTQMKPGDPDYISPEKAAKRLAAIFEAARGGAAEPLPETQPRPFTPPPPIDLAQSIPLKISVVDASGKPACFFLKLQASGMNLLAGGEYHRGTFSGRVPAGPVKVEIHGGLFRRPLIRETAAKPGGNIDMRVRFEQGLLPEITSHGYTPYRVLCRGMNRQERERAASVWQSPSIASEDDIAGGLAGALMPPWPGYGRSVAIGDEGAKDLFASWRRSDGALPGAVFLGDERVKWAAAVLPEETGRQFISPRRAYLLWEGLKESFPTAGIFEDALPAELPVLCQTGLVQAVCVPPSREGLETFVALNRLYPALLPAPPAPKAREAFPDVLVWGRNISARQALQLLRSGSYTVGRGMYMTAEINGKPPSVEVPFALHETHRFRIAVFTGKLGDAGIDELLIYRNGRVFHREPGQANETRMEAVFNVHEREPAYYWAAAVGRAKEKGGVSMAADDASFSNETDGGTTVLWAMSALFCIGNVPAPPDEERLIAVRVVDMGGKPLEGAQVSGGGDAAVTDERGAASVAWKSPTLITAHLQERKASLNPLA
ncbi:MAG TPA: hypothetical protein ENN09_05220, partial [Planctomycetes bacterium]|nr:hypothetical protein [Planctomycetota bacterium]